MRLYFSCACLVIASMSWAMNARAIQAAQDGLIFTADSGSSGAAGVDAARNAKSKVVSAGDSVSVYLGAYHLVIPRRYFAAGTYSVQTTNHLVLDVQLPEIRPMTEGERSQVATTGRMLPDTAHIILEAGDHLLYGEKMFDRMTRISVSDVPPIKYLEPQKSDAENMVVFHNAPMAKDIYLVKNSSPKFFFDCDQYNKFSINPHCFYYGQLIGNVQFQIWYRKNNYFNQIVAFTPRIKNLLDSFIKP